LAQGGAISPVAVISWMMCIVTHFGQNFNCMISRTFARLL